ncbi:MAG TPA: rod shape-determining protein MreD [Actinomycetes bacterium]|nr:rod shape-determining protein MreD [Actinomycetes bacterium]
MIRRVLALAAVLVGALVVQTTVLSQVRILGARPDLVVLAIVAVAMSSDPVAGATFGFAAGLARDLLLDLPVGVSALVDASLGYAIGTARVYMVSRSPLVPATVVVAASLASVWATGAVLRLLDLSGFSWGYVARSALAVAAGNLLATPLVYPLMRGVVERSRAERVMHL